MNLEAVQKKGRKTPSVYFSGATWKLTSAFVFFFFLVGPVVPSPLDLFFGADDNKIREIPKYLKICHREDRQFDKCVKSSLEKFLESVNSGSEEQNLPNIDPIEVPVLEYRQGSGNVSIHITFKDFRIFGFKYFKIMSVKSNVLDNKFEISMKSPFVDMMGRFSAEGGVFTFPISGQGDFHLNLTDVSAILILRLATTDDATPLRYLTVEDCLMDLLPGEISAYVGEYIDGSNAIGSAVNTFFNRYGQEIFIMIKPKITGILADVFSAIANEVLGRHPDDVLLPD